MNIADSDGLTVNGNVGIGTTTPQTKLEVISDSDPTLSIRSDSTFGETTSLSIRGARNLTTTNDSAIIELRNFDDDEGESGTDFELARIGAAMQDVTGQTGYMRFYTNNGNGVSERMRIDKEGNVGIGTESPNDQLHLLSSSSNRIFVESTSSSAFAGIRFKTPNQEYFTGINSGSSDWVVYDNTSATARLTINSSSLVVSGPSGNSQVILPEGSISAFEMHGEPGIVSQNNSSSLTLNTSNMIDLETLEISIPTSGYVVVEGRCNVRLFGTTSLNKTFVQIDTGMGGTQVAPYYIIAGLGAYASTGGNHFPVYVNRVFSVSAGTHTYRLEAMKTGPFGTAEALNAFLTATYYPTAYGDIQLAQEEAIEEVTDLDIANDYDLYAGEEFSDLVADQPEQTDFIVLVQELQQQNQDLFTRLNDLEELIEASMYVKVGGER